MHQAEQRLNQDIEAIRIRLASPEEILSWSKGEVIKPETINYRTQKPEKDGLFSERIFGPVKDWECSCGKYKKVRHKGIVCDRCGVEVTRSSVRRERMGHIKLANACAHIWFLRSVPSRIGLILDMPLLALERVVYYASWVVIAVDKEAKSKFLEKLRASYETKTKKERKRSRELKAKMQEALRTAEEDLGLLKAGRILTESEFLRFERTYPGVAECGIGAEAIKKMLQKLDLAKVEEELKETSAKAKGPAKHKILIRLRLVRSLLAARLRPEWMILDVIPVLPPELRPMVALDGGRYASSDLNDLYRRVINRNNRLKRLLDLKAPEVIVRNERRMLQEAVDALLDNSMRRGGGVSMLGAARRPLRSLADILRGKTGRFRQNLLGKRVDYSGRSVIVVGPELKLSQCGIPKKMALELFKPFVMRKLIEKELAHNIRGAARLIDDASEAVWAVLDEVIEDTYVLLNRAPTLHRLGIQAFRPKLIEGLAIQLHPLVCEAYNADFDGDQMAVHVPLSEEAQKEARVLMSSLHNLWKPATGNSIVGPFRDIVVGLYWLTTIRPGAKGEGKVFASPEEVLLARDSGHIDFRSAVRLPKEYLTLFEPVASGAKPGSEKRDKEAVLDNTTFITSAGRILLRLGIPKEVLLPNKELSSKSLRSLIERIVETLKEPARIEAALDTLKDLGFWAASISGISWGMDDLVVPEQKQALLRQAHAAIRELERGVERGLMTEDEKRARAIEIWSNLKSKVEEAARAKLDPYGPVLPIVTSGARGSWAQLVQVVGMKGLVANPKGEVIELPILSSFIEGLNVLEYFISTHGARKGTADTALKTAAAGYLTRRLVEAGQEIVVVSADCADAKGWEITRTRSEELGLAFWFRLFSRYLAADVRTPQGKLIAQKGELVTREKAHEIERAGVLSVRVRSPFSCRSLRGICARCYGMELGRLEPVELGTAVGIIAAQSIGEPGTQLTMRTFHIGGVAGAGDITTGLPRVEELFETRSPKNSAMLSPFDAQVVVVESSNAGTIIKLKGKAKGKKQQMLDLSVEPGVAIRVKAGDEVSAGDAISEGVCDPKELFRLSSRERAARYLIEEVLRTYSSQGVSIHDKHIEVIARQMFSRMRITDSGDSRFMSDEVVSRTEFELECQRLKGVRNAKLPKGDELLLGITRIALSTPSVLSAASFQETTRVLVSAGLEGRMDRLEGLKENIIIGRLIPVGMGWRQPEA